MPLSTFLNGRAPTRGLPWLALSDTGNVLIRTSVDDSGGGATQSWTAGSALPCRIDPLGTRGRGLVGGRIDERSTHVVTVPAGTPVASEDRFAITGRGTFEVLATHDRTAEWTRPFEVMEVE